MKNIVKKALACFWEWLPLFLISLVPLLWFEPNHLINPNDTNFPLDPIALFKQRLFTWNSQHGVGINFSFDTAGISFHGLQALIYSLGFSVIQTEKIFLCIWFFLLLASFYYSIKSLIETETRVKIVPYLATIFYVFNPYLFNIFSNINAANMAALFFIPVSTAFLLRLISRRISFRRYLVIFPFVCFVSAPMGINLPVLATVVFYLALLFIGLIFYYRRLKFKRVMFTFATFFFFFTLFNAYWILPDLMVLTQESAFSLPSAAELKSLLAGFSEFNGINNLFRLQGDWVWRYEGFRGEKFVIYADKFINNPILIVISFIAPVLFIISLIFVKRKFVIFCGVLLIPSLIFSSGSHLPLGSIFLFLTRKIPLFSVFRSPWYKFSILTVFVYATAAGLFFDYLLKKKRETGLLIILLMTVGQLIYAHPLLTKEIFPAKRVFLPPAQFIVPKYPQEAANFLNNIEGDFTVISLPINPADVYQWGFNAPYDLLNLYAPNKGILAGPAQNNASGLYEMLYQGLISGYLDLTKQMNFINSWYLIHKKDIIFDFYYGSDEPRLIENLLKNQKTIRRVNNFGPWDFYENTSVRPGLISLTGKLNRIFGKKETLGGILTLDEFDEKGAVVIGEKIPPGITPTKNIFPIKLMPRKTENVFSYSFPFVKYLSGSILYPLVRVKEKYQTNNIPEETFEGLQFRLQTMGKRIIELKRLLEERKPGFQVKKIADEYLDELNALEKFLFIKMIDNPELSTYLRIAQPALDSYLKEINLFETEKSGLIERTKVIKEKIADFIANKLSSNKILRYKASLPNEGFFTFYLMRIQSPRLFEEKVINLEIDGKSEKYIFQVDKNDWLKIDGLNLPKGEHIIGVPVEAMANFVDYYDWEFSNAKKDGQEIFLDADKEIATASVKVRLFENTNPSMIYFNYNATVGDTFRIDIYQINKSEYQTRQEARLIQNLGAGEWQNFLFEFQTDLKTDYLTLLFNLKPSTEKEIKNVARIKDLRIYKKPRQLILVEKNEEGRDLVSSPKVEVKKINPTLYRVKVYDSQLPEFLIFRQTCNPLWKASISGKTLPKFNQAGYFNGWLVDQGGNFEIIIEYLPQRLFILGLDLGLGSLIAIGVSLLIKKERKDENKKKFKN